MNIPTILNICCVYTEPKSQQNIQEIRSNQPGLTIIEWDITLYEQLITKHYPQILNIFKSAELDIEKAFIGRIAALHQYGGIMASSAMRLIKKIESFIDYIGQQKEAYIKCRKASTILFENMPFDFEYNAKISNNLIASEPQAEFLTFCLEHLSQNIAPYISKADLVKLKLKNIDEQVELISRQYGESFLYDRQKEYIYKASSNSVAVMPYYLINPCFCRSISDPSKYFILNGPVTDEQFNESDREWEPIQEKNLTDKRLERSFFQNICPHKSLEDYIKTKVAMLVWQFPSRSNTFVMNEVVEMHKRGVDLTIYSMSVPTAECEIIFKEELSQIKDCIINIPYNKLLCHKALEDDKIAFFKNDFRNALELFKTVDSTGEHYNQQEQESVQNSNRFLSQLIADIRARGIQKIYAPFANADAEIAMMLSYHTGIPYYFTAHAFDLFSTYYYARMKAKTASHIFAISEYNKRYMVENLGIPEDKITVRRINFLAPNIQDVIAKDIGSEYIFTAARFHEMKGFKYSIEAFANFRKTNPNVHYVIVGCGELQQEIEDLIIDLQLQESVHLVGHVSNHQVLEFVKGAEFSILSSIEMPNKDKEGLPTCFVESMSLGTPCVGTDYSGTPELIDHGINGMLTKEKDVSDISNKMCKLYDMIKSDSKGAISESCKLKVKKMFNNEENIELLLKHLK